MLSCSNCGTSNPEGARFCNQCGTVLDAAPAQVAERRQITVVFSDLSGFTAMSEHLDPEDVQSVMSEIFTDATRIITKYGGRVDKLIGDAVMAVFGDPTAHEDDAERAIRATIEIHEAVDALSPRLEPRIGRPLVMHSGVNTGVVVTSAGSMDTADTGPLGDTINLAARLEGLSEPGEILIGPETAALVAGVFELSDHGSHDLKGKSGPVQVSRVEGLKASRGRPSRRQGDFVGRHEELGVLLGSVEKVQDGIGSVIGIRAEAGAGKTRLLEEFRTQVRDKVQWLEGRAYAYGENIPFAALVNLVSNAVGITEDDTTASIATKLREGVTGLVDDVQHVLGPINRLYGLDVGEGAGLDKESFRPRLLESMTAVVEGLASRAPTVLVFQDLHWADPSTVEVIGAIVRQVASPIVIVVNYRPTFEGSLPAAREIQLQPLSPRQIGQLVGSLLETDAPPGELVDFVTDRTDGNPFYLEEIINSLVETGTLVGANGSWRVEGAFADADIPTSVRGVIAARIDRLDTGRRRVLREASVVGREFLYDIIRRVATETAELDPSLQDLESADLIRERPEQADLEYFFKHALTQDVAYEGLLRQERTQLHARAAAAIEEQFTGRLEEVTETLAFHYAEGAVTDKAIHYLRRAGLKAMDRYALIESQAHFEKAYDMATTAQLGETTDRALVEVLLDWSILFYYRAILPQFDKIMDRHQDAMERLDDPRLRMWWLIWRGHARGFLLDHRDVLDYLEPALAIAEELADDDAIAYIETWRGWAFSLQGRWNDAIASADSIIPYITEHRERDPYPYLKTVAQKALTIGRLGQYDEAEALCAELISFGERAGNTRCQAMGYQMRSSWQVATMSIDAAAVSADAAISVAVDPIYRDSARMVRGLSAAAAGDQAMLAHVVEDIRREEKAGVRLVMPVVVTLLESLLGLGGPDPASNFDRLLAIPAEANRYRRFIEATFCDLFIAIAFGRIATGEEKGDWKTLLRNPRVLKHVRKARREALPRLERLIEGAGQMGFAGFLPLIRFELAKLLIATGGRADARRHLELALDQIAPLGETEGAARITELLATV